MVKNFKGVVRVADVQEEFDSLVNGINSIVKTYNSQSTLVDFDFTKGGEGLASKGYSLSVGGLKQLGSIYANTILGCKVFKIDSNTLFVTDGMYCDSDGKFKRIKQSAVKGSGNTLYYDITNGGFTFGNGTTYINGEEAISVTSTTYTDWSSPQLYSNTSYGQISTNMQNSGDVWRCTTSSSAFTSIPGGQSRGTYTIRWAFPSTVKISSVSFELYNWTGIGTGPYIKVWAGGVYMGQTTGASGGKTFTANLGDKECSYLDITVECYATYIMAWRNLKITGQKAVTTTTSTVSGTAVQSGETIKLCDINWKRTTSDEVRDRKNVQLENVDGYSVNIVSGTNTGTYMHSVYEQVSNEGQGWAYGYIKGSQSGRNIQPGHRNRAMIRSMSWVFTPVGASSPFSTSGAAGDGGSRDFSYQLKLKKSS